MPFTALLFRMSTFVNNRIMNISENIKNEIYERFHNSSDLNCLDIDNSEVRGVLLFVDGLTERTLLLETLLKPLSNATLEKPPYLDALKKSLLSVSKIVLSADTTATCNALAGGDCALVLDNSAEVFIFSLRQYPTRAIAEPPTSSVLRGPREGFTEDMKINQSLLRRRLRSPDLTYYQCIVGRYTQTSVTVAYIKGIANEAIVNGIIKKITAIDTDGIIDSSYIQRYLEERPDSMFKQVGSTEKPDILCAKLLEGRVGVIVDGSPIVLTLPFILWESFQDSQDYFKRDARATFTRILRMLGIFMAVLLPAIFVAVQEYQYQMIPLKFLLTIVNVTNGIPLTPALEMLTVLLVFEILNEASVRMPRYVGMALSIVGAIVLGDTAVSAGLLSSPAVLIMALSAIGLYCVPDEAGIFSIFRVFFVLVAGVLGLFGIILGLIILLAYLVDVNSYGSPYLSPFAPYIPNDMQDTIIKINERDMKKRPESIPNNGNTTRRG